MMFTRLTQSMRFVRVFDAHKPHGFFIWIFSIAKFNSFPVRETPVKPTRKYAILISLAAAPYTIVDQIRIVNADSLDFRGNAANTAVPPPTVPAPAIAVMIGDEVRAFVSLLLGRKSQSDVHKPIDMAVTLTVGSNAVATAMPMSCLTDAHSMPRPAGSLRTPLPWSRRLHRTACP